MKSHGFSLLETMVALSVFSIAAMGLLSLNTQSVRTSSELGTRLLARTVAENLATDTVTGSFSGANLVATGDQIQRGRTYAWKRTVEATPRPGLYSIRIEVSEGESPIVIARLSFLAIESAPQ